HVAGVYDAAAQALTVYINGQANNGSLSGTVPNSQADSPFNVNIGNRPGATGNAFAGAIDDVRIYDRALSQSEIQADMNSALADSVFPSVSLTSPANGALLSGAVSVT